MLLGNAAHSAQTVHTTRPVLIIDCPVERTLKDQFSICRTHRGEQPLVVDSCDLSPVLDHHISNLVLPQQTLFVFPGNGGIDVEKSLTGLHSHSKKHVSAKRIWHQGSDPVVMVDEIPTTTFIDLYTKAIFVLDDVVGSGQTAHKILAINEWKFPAATWYLGSWIDRGLKVKGFRHTFSALTIRHAETPEKKVPINSLSTLIKDPSIAGSYAEKNYRNHQEFLHLLEQVRERT